MANATDSTDESEINRVQIMCCLSNLGQVFSLDIAQVHSAAWLYTTGVFAFLGASERSQDGVRADINSWKGSRTLRSPGAEYYAA